MKRGNRRPSGGDQFGCLIPLAVFVIVLAMILPLFGRTAHAAPDGHRARRMGVAVVLRFGPEARERRHDRRVERIKRGKQLDALKADRRSARDKLRRARQQRE